METVSARADEQMWPAGLRPRHTPGARVTQTGEGIWRFEIPGGPAKRYRLAQLDNYGGLPRQSFPHNSPFLLRLQARASHGEIPGTWGFGLWNNPFGMAILSGVEVLRLPALPNSAWFFFASAHNYLSLRDDQPAHGWLASTFRSPRLPALLLALGGPALPLLALPPTARLLRRLGRRFVREDAAQVEVEVREWHTYQMAWRAERVIFSVDEAPVLETAITPNGPLGLVLWVDNQYAALTPSGRFRFGSLPNPEPAWVEVRDFSIRSKDE